MRPIELPNAQPIERLVRDTDGKMLDVHSLFLTVQGEGPFSGCPAVFVRLAGCNLRCPNCFHGRTEIRMADYSTKLISEVRVGDMVLSYSVKKQRFVKRRITAVMSRQVSSIRKLDTGRKTYVTREHPVLVRGRGWVAVRDLRPGDKIVHLSTAELMRLNNPMKDEKTVARVVSTSRERGHYDDGGVFGRMSPEKKDACRQKAVDRMSGPGNPMKDKETAVKAYLARKTRGQMTTVERFVRSVAKSSGIEFVGGGDLVIGHKIPDFVIPGTKKVIETWDADQTGFLGRTEEWQEARRKVFAAEGYDVLFLPVTPYPMHGRVGTRKPDRARRRAKEIARVRRLVAEFARNGETVRHISPISRKADQKAWVRLAGSKDANLTVYNLEVEGTHTYVANGMVVHNCDTDYTTGRGGMAIGDVLLQAMNLSHGGRTLGRKVTDLIVLTGGEPFRQPIGPLVRLLLDSDFRVQIETNGTLWLDDFPWHDPKLTVVCSPKTHVHARVINAVRHWKYVIDHRHVDERTGLPTKVLGQYVPGPPGPGTVWISPMDEGPGKDVENALNRQACVKSALAFGHRISLQTHKLLGVE